MKRFKHKLLMLISSGLFLIAIQNVNVISYRHTYQEKEPEALKKYERY